VKFQEVVHSILAGKADVAKQKRFAEDRMDTHKNARLTPKGREEMVCAVVDKGLSKAQAARRYNTTPKSVAKWVDRFRKEGVDGLRDRSSRPLSSPSQTSQATCDAVELLRRQRRTQQHIAAELAISKASVSRILKRRGLSRLSSLEPQQPRPRYEREKPGEIIHLDVKKLGCFNRMGHRITGLRSRLRGSGWEFVHVAIDDHSRVARVDIFPDQTKHSAVAFLIATVAYFKSLGIIIERVMTDNGGCYISKAFKRACRQLGIKHIRTKPYTPQTNGKAERFIQTALREWAYATAFENSEQRRTALPTWLHRYNWHRPHVSLGRKPPISRLSLTGNNVLSLHS
jgi:transposase InsO family protein